MKIQFFLKNEKITSCLDLKDLSKSFRRNVKIMVQGACIQKTETLLLKCTKVSHNTHEEGNNSNQQGGPSMAANKSYTHKGDYFSRF